MIQERTYSAVGAAKHADETWITDVPCPVDFLSLQMPPKIEYAGISVNDGTMQLHHDFNAVTRGKLKAVEQLAQLVTIEEFRQPRPPPRGISVDAVHVHIQVYAEAAPFRRSPQGSCKTYRSLPGVWRKRRNKRTRTSSNQDEYQNYKGTPRNCHQYGQRKAKPYRRRIQTGRDENAPNQSQEGPAKWSHEDEPGRQKAGLFYPESPGCAFQSSCT
jgi:hypothetical protein